MNMNTTGRLALILSTFMMAALSGANEQMGLPKETSSARYKNIRVLKKLPADRLLATMQEFNTALNVSCSFCHETQVGPDGKRSGYERDNNPMKARTREMIRLVETLNKREKTLYGQATCYMCHHGHPEPTTRPTTVGSNLGDLTRQHARR